MADTTEKTRATPDPAPYMRQKQAAAANDAGKDYFIPLLLAVVVIVITSATFFSEEITRMKAALGLVNETVATIPADTPVKRYSTAADSTGVTMLPVSDAGMQPTPFKAATPDEDAGAFPAADASRTSAPVYQPGNKTARIRPDNSPVTANSVNDPDRYRNNLARQAVDDAREMNAFRAEIARRMEQDRRDMHEHMHRIQKDIQRMREANMQRLEDRYLKEGGLRI